ncbi:MAG: hypothetical protein M1309_06210 [Actinobacteria bacterium]|nr:hypothetical protein [Actinomycetota bacterium]
MDAGNQALEPALDQHAAMFGELLVAAWLLFSLPGCIAFLTPGVASCVEIGLWRYVVWLCFWQKKLDVEGNERHQGGYFRSGRRAD